MYVSEKKRLYYVLSFFFKECFVRIVSYNSHGKFSADKKFKSVTKENNDFFMMPHMTVSVDYDSIWFGTGRSGIMYRMWMDKYTMMGTVTSYNT